jgi:hypothetical protein
LAVASRTDAHHIVLRRDDRRHSFPHKRVIIDTQNSNCFGLFHNFEG